MRTWAYINEVAADTVVLFDGSNNPVTGESGNFLTVLQKNGVYSATPAVTVTEISAGSFPGAYRVTFTPDALGDFDVRVSHATYAKAGWLISFNVIEREVDFVFGATLNTAGDTLTVISGLLNRGLLISNSKSVAVTIYDSAATLIKALADASADANGIFNMTWSSPTLTSGNVYQAKIVIIDNNDTSYTGFRSIKVE